MTIPGIVSPPAPPPALETRAWRPYPGDLLCTQGQGAGGRGQEAGAGAGGRRQEEQGGEHSSRQQDVALAPTAH